MRHAALRLGAHLNENAWAVWLVKNGIRVRAGFHGVENLGPQFQLLAIPAAPGLPRFHIFRKGVLTAANVFGRHAIELGHTAFDQVFKVVTEEVDVVRAMLTPQRATMLASDFPDAELRCTGNELELLRPGMYVGATDEIFDLGIKLLLDLAGHDAYGRGPLLALPGATFHDLPRPHIAVAAPAPLQAWYVRDDDDLLATEMRADANVSVIPPDVLAEAKALGATATVEYKAIVLTWPTVVRDSTVLRAAVDLLRRLISGPHEGVFR